MKNVLLLVWGWLWNNVVRTPSFLILCFPAFVAFLLGNVMDAQVLLLLYVIWKLRALLAVFAVFGAVASIGS